MNYNNLPANAFEVSIPSLRETSFRTQGINIPGFQLEPIVMPYPGAEQSFAGATYNYEDLTIEFILDEDLKIYDELTTWLNSQQKYEGNIYRDLLVVTLTASSIANRVFTFKNAFPFSIGSIQFRTDVGTAITYLTCTATFKFSEFKLNAK